MSDPRHIPDEDEVEESGAGNWAATLFAEQSAKNRRLAGMFGDEGEEIHRRKSQLSGLLDAAVEGLPDDEDEEPAPDLFGAERQAMERSRRGLADLFAEEEAEREAERRRLGDLFGDGGGRGKKR